MKGDSNEQTWLNWVENHLGGPSEVERRETHISNVFLTPEAVYKFKKPVQFDFLDFGTLEARKTACLEELRLNRRLAPDVYLGLVRVVHDPVSHTLLFEDPAEEGTNEETVEWGIKMRRLADEASLAHHLNQATTQTRTLDPLVDCLVRFYGQLPPEHLGGDAYLAEVRQHVAENGESLIGLFEPIAGNATAALARIRRIQSRQTEFLFLEADLVRARAGAEGCPNWLRDGHGDLRPDHIYLETDPVVIDCIEFNRKYRVNDTADELAFLAVLCEFFGAETIGQQLAEAVATGLGDPAPVRLREFYQTYRACVRAKVAALRAAQVSGADSVNAWQEANRFLDLADKHGQRLGRPLLIVVRGLMGSGKTTIAKRLAERLSAPHLETDAIRIRIAPLGDVDRDVAEPAYAEGRYAPERRAEVYRTLESEAADWLQQGQSVVCDGAFLKTESLLRMQRLAEEHGADWAVIECGCPEAVARERIARRRASGLSASEARPELLAEQRQEWEPAPGPTDALTVDSSLDLERLEETVRVWLAEREAPTA